jgi:choice-of-anchor A domain-containing protein
VSILNTTFNKVIVAVGLLTSAFYTHSTPINFDDLGNANGYFFGDFEGNFNDSQDALLIGGNATFNGYTIATLNNSNDLALVVKGDLSITGGDVNGLTSAGGATSVSSTNALTISDESRAFDKAHFVGLSNGIASHTSQDASVSSGVLQLAGNLDNNTLFVNTSIDDLNSVWGLFSQNIDFGTRLVINVSGSDITLNSKDWLIKNESYVAHQSENVLYNFYEASDLTIAGALYGSILAPNADIVGNGGMVYGQVIGNSFTGGSQLNSAVFNADPSTTMSPETSVEVSAPASLTLMFWGLVGVALTHRRKALRTQKQLLSV